jgi:hypothetical protein
MILSANTRGLASSSGQLDTNPDDLSCELPTSSVCSPFLSMADSPTTFLNSTAAPTSRSSSYLRSHTQLRRRPHPASPLPGLVPRALAGLSATSEPAEEARLYKTSCLTNYYPWYMSRRLRLESLILNNLIRLSNRILAPGSTNPTSQAPSTSEV